MRTLLVLASIVLVVSACAQMRQNLRGQELSYRGAWFCGISNCSDDEMVRSTSGTREEGVEIASVRMQPRVALAFTAQTAFDRLDVMVEDCNGRKAAVPAASIKKPGEHAIGDDNAKESWMVELDQALGLRFGKKCRWTATVVGTWSDGATFTSQAGIRRK